MTASPTPQVFLLWRPRVVLWGWIVACAAAAVLFLVHPDLFLMNYGFTVEQPGSEDVAVLVRVFVASCFAVNVFLGLFFGRISLRLGLQALAGTLAMYVLVRLASGAVGGFANAGNVIELGYEIVLSAFTFWVATLADPDERLGA